MPHKPSAYVLDSWAIIAYLEDEPSGEKVADLIAAAHENGTPLKMTVVNIGEIWYILARETSELEADRSIYQLHELGIEFIAADWKLTLAAARFKARHKMSYADGYAAALAQQEKGAVLLTGDKEFKQVEKDITIYWL
ncbi:MAG: type II toxin-antitoxin system VapC family toxin [Chitinivibrionales bacterium]|nr:type II toxin-antitoxin system VapC family toxin [Chitinivibrionales bacterium]